MYKLGTQESYMDDSLNIKTIKENAREMLCEHPLFRTSNVAMINREEVLAFLWNWTYDIYPPLHPITNPEKILVKLQDIYGDIPMEVEIDREYPYSPIRYLKLTLPNSIWYISKNGSEFRIECSAHMACVQFVESDRTVEWIHCFDKHMPEIRQYIEELLSQKAIDLMVYKIEKTTSEAITSRNKGTTIIQ